MGEGGRGWGGIDLIPVLHIKTDQRHGRQRLPDRWDQIPVSCNAVRLIVLKTTPTNLIVLCTLRTDISCLPWSGLCQSNLRERLYGLHEYLGSGRGIRSAVESLRDDAAGREGFHVILTFQISVESWLVVPAESRDGNV